MAKALKFGSTILCEYVARGQGNKQILVNTYSGDIIVADFPAMLGLGLYSEFYASRLGAHTITFDFNMDNKQFAELRVDVEIADLSSPACITFPSASFRFETETVFEVVARSAGFSRTRLISKRVFAGTVPA